MKVISSLFMTLLLMVIGASLIGSVNSSQAAITTPTYTANVVSLVALLPLLFVVMIILYAFRGFESI